MKQLDTLLKELELGRAAQDRLYDAIGMINNLSQKEVSDNRIVVACIFEKILKNAQNLYAPEYVDISVFPGDFLDQLLILYTNIHALITEATEEEKRDGSIIFFIFLSFLERHNQIGDNPEFGKLDEVQEYVSTLSDLDDVRFIFDVKKDGISVFPIEEMLAYVIQDKQFVSNTTKSLSPFHIQILKFAVRFFKPGTKGEEELNELVDACNLGFVNYLNPNDYMVDTPDLLNYRMNGVMMFIKTGVDNKVLIRSNREGYFSKRLLKKKNYELKEEVARNEDYPIGWFVEFDFDGSDLKDASKLMIQQDSRMDVLKLYFSGNCNIFLEMSLYRDLNGDFAPLNPFCKSDQYVICGNEFYPKDSLKDIFVKYYNLPYKVSRINFFNRIMVGTLVSLMELDRRKTEDLLDMSFKEDDFYQNQLIYSWLKNSPSDLDLCGSMLGKWYLQLEYCKRSETDTKKNGMTNIANYMISSQGFFPFAADYQKLLCYVFNNDEYSNAEISEESLVSDGEGQMLVIVRKDGNTIHLWLDDIDDRADVKRNLYSGSKCYLVFVNGKWIFEDQNLLKEVSNLKRLFERCMDFDSACSVPAISYSKVVGLMRLHREALSEDIKRVFPEENFEDQVYYRILHNMLCFGIKSNTMEDYFSVFLGHDVLDFHGIEDDPVFALSDVNTLYVPKNASKAKSVLEDVYNNLLRSDAHRTKTGLYNNELGFVNGKYTRNGQIIKKIVILCDNFEVGTQTTHLINAYFQIDISDAAAVKEAGRIQRYYCEGREISLEDVRVINECKVDVYAYYGTDDGKNVIQKYMDEAGICGVADFAVPITRTIMDILPFAKKAFPDEHIAENGYAVVRKYNMTKCNVFPDKMLTNPKKAITLFVKKDEISLTKREMRIPGNNSLFRRMEGILKRDFSNVDAKKIRKEFMDSMANEPAGLISSTKMEQFGITALVHYFMKNGVSDRDVISASVLTVISVLPPRIRIIVWERMVNENHSLIVLEKLSKAYAKDGKIEVLKEKLQEWVDKEYVSEDMAEQLWRASEPLYTYRDRFPIADDMIQARDNFEEVLTFTEAPEEFLEIMRLFVG